jgi:hypothetical protein
MQDKKAGHTAKSALLPGAPEDKMTENQRGSLVLPYTTH